MRELLFLFTYTTCQVDEVHEGRSPSDKMSQCIESVVYPPSEYNTSMSHA